MSLAVLPNSLNNWYRKGGCVGRYSKADKFSMRNYENCDSMWY